MSSNSAAQSRPRQCRGGAAGTSEPSVKTQPCRRRRLLSPIRANVNAVSPSPALGTDYPAHEVHDFRRRRIAPHFDNCRVSACIIKAGGDEFLHTKLPHVAERHRWAGWMFRLGHTGRVAGLASPGQATICNYTSVSVAYANLEPLPRPPYSFRRFCLRSPQLRLRPRDMLTEHHSAEPCRQPGSPGPGS